MKVPDADVRLIIKGVNETPMSAPLGFTYDLGNGTTVDIGRIQDTAEVFLQFSRTAEDEDADTPDFLDGARQIRFRRDGKIITIVRLTDNAAFAVAELVHTLSFAEYKARCVASDLSRQLAKESTPPDPESKTESQI